MKFIIAIITLFIISITASYGKLPTNLSTTLHENISNQVASMKTDINTVKSAIEDYLLSYYGMCPVPMSFYLAPTAETKPSSKFTGYIENNGQEGCSIYVSFISTTPSSRLNPISPILNGSYIRLCAHINSSLGIYSLSFPYCYTDIPTDYISSVLKNQGSDFANCTYASASSIPPCPSPR